ncbi:MAG: amidohydrolase family protein [Saprospiraceae bacterium]
MKRIQICFLLIFFVSILFSQETFPINDIQFKKGESFALINATIVKDANSQPLQNGVILISKGKISLIGTNLAIPPDAMVKDCKGKMIYPSFIDIYSDYGMPAVQSAQRRGFGGPAQMESNAKNAAGWNAAIKAEQNAAMLFQTNENKAKEFRSNGFGMANVHMQDGIVRGNGSLVSLANKSNNLTLLKERTTAHFSFDKGSSTQDYPGSLMGAISLIRQTFLDGKWYKTKPAMEGTNLSLAAFNELQNLPMIFEAGDKWNDLRASKIAMEFGQNFMIVGGGDEYQRINEIKQTGARLIIPLNYPNAQDVEDPNDARLVSLADLKHWEMAPSNPAAIEKAGIDFALTTYSLKDASSFLSNINKAIQYGLSESCALKALTSIPAQMLGIQSQFGSLEPGKYANLIITDGPLFKEKTTILENWIQGEQYILKPEGWKNYQGDYTFTVNNTPYQMTISGEGQGNVAKIIVNDTVKTKLKFNDKLIQFNYSLTQDSSKINRMSGVQIGDGWNGTGTLANGEWVRWSLSKTNAVTSAKTDKKEASIKSVDIGKVMYPFQGFGNEEIPKQENVLIKNATIWTCDQAGKLENTDILIQNGKISNIGKNLSAGNAIIIDGTGKHVTPGIIDEHSHIAGTGSINECTQSVTAEVRIADIINPDDINIYRQLSGGVTSSHILHGSCNTIGGQTQLLKLRWGKNAEEMKFEGWPGFIKFALGENVKRASNTQNNRFPDTRMGVEQVLEDAFVRAKAYASNIDPNKRKDLELDALVEILDNKRFITCHSYIASEILALLHIAEKYNFKVNTFTHILEGYKVADQMKKQGSAAAGFSDWWAYKLEVVDAIPQNAYIMNKVGLNVAINSDDAEMARRLNQEAAKSIKYAGMNEEAALKLVTINPAEMLHVGDRTGSLKIGKDADLVIWSDHPLSIYAKAEKTMVDGTIYFDRDKDAEHQKWIAQEKNRLIQKSIGAKKSGARTDPALPSFSEEEHCEEDHPHGSNLWQRLEQRMINSSN